MDVSTAHPIQTLRQHSTNFEAVLSVCLASPKEKAVHKLRTESRRLEAQIALLLSMRDLPPFRSEARKAQLQIKKVRQAAGRVRDLDVQSNHLKQHLKGTRASSSPAEEKQQSTADIGAMLGKRKLRRTKAAADLLKEIQTRQAKVSAALEKLNSALKDAGPKSLPSTELLAIAQARFKRTPALKLRKPSADDLHTVRKAAKQARYVAENAGSVAATDAAKHFEHLQELGGAWHDWLELSASARKELGRKHGITDQFTQKRDQNLKSFKLELASFIAPAAPKKIIAPAVSKKKKAAAKAR